MDFMARATAVVGGTMVLLRRFKAPRTQAVGDAPAIPTARKQGIMTRKMPTAKGWVDGHVPHAAPGLRVNAFASGLDHPRWNEPDQARIPGHPAHRIAPEWLLGLRDLPFGRRRQTHTSRPGRRPQGRTFSRARCAPGEIRRPHS